MGRFFSVKNETIVGIFLAPRKPKTVNGQSQARSGDSNEFELKGAAGVVTKCGGGSRRASKQLQF